MADYPLKQEAAEVQDILDTSLTFNNKYPQTLSEEEKAFTREKIGASAVGEGIKIMSHFDTLAELTEAITSPKPGDAFSVGTELPYNLYIYDFLRGEWRNYGPIRANDIKARFAQNIAVPVSTWLEDTSVFVDYSYRARIALAEVTGNDFPIVAFAPFDAISGNLCPVAYSFDGYIEIWAKSIPTAAITVPAVTFIVQDITDAVTGNSTKGITNASGGIATGGISTEQIANGSLTTPKYANGSVTRAKLAQDVLYSPVRNVSGDYALTAEDLDVLLRPGHNDALNVTLSLALSKALPSGATFIVFRYGGAAGNDVTITFEGMNVCSSGWETYLAGPTLRISETYSAVALQKMTTADMWYVTGFVEVVS